VLEVGARKFYVCTILALVWRTRKSKKTHRQIGLHLEWHWTATFLSLSH